MMQKTKRFLALLLALALLLTLAACGKTEDGNTDAPDTATKPVPDAQPEQGAGSHQAPDFAMEDYTLRNDASIQEIGELLADIVSGESYSSAENVGIVDEFFSESNRPAFAGNYGESIGSTAVLPEGVAKADTAVLADGYAYRVQNGELTILEAKGKDSAVLSTTTVTSPMEAYESYEESAQAVAVLGDRAAVMTYVYAWSTIQADNGEWTSETVSKTHVKLYDITDKKAPKELSHYIQDGSFGAAYLAGERLYLLSDYFVMNLDAADAATYMPEAGPADQVMSLATERIYVNDQTDTARFTLVTALEMNSGEAQTVALTGGFDPAFLDADTLYLSGWCYAAKESEQYEENQYQVTDFYSHAITLVARMDGADGLKLTGTACINGRLSDPAQLDIQEGYVRLATLAEHYTNRLFEDEAMGFANLEMGEHFFSNEIHVLDPEMKRVGELTGLSDSCLTYYQRFVGSTGYVLAYDMEDPVYTLDMTDPTAPAMGESLPLEGAAELLVPFGERLLGFAADGQLQLLQAEGGQLATLAKTSIGDDYLTVRYSLASILTDAASGLVALPATDGLLLFRVQGEEIQSIGTVEMAVTDRTRVLLDDGLLYVVGDAGYTVIDGAKGEELAQINIAVG